MDKTVSRLISERNFLLAAIQQLQDRIDEKQGGRWTPKDFSDKDAMENRIDGITERLGDHQAMSADIQRRIMNSNLPAAEDDSHLVFDRTGGGPYVPGGYTDAANLPGSPLYGSMPRIVVPQLHCFKGGGNRRQAVDDAYASMLWLRAVVQRDDPSREKLASRFGQQWLAVHTENVPGDGGYLVPAPLETAIIEYRQMVGAVRRLFAHFPMGSETLQHPKHVSGLTVYYPGEGNEITESDVEIGRISLTAKKRAVLAYVTNELRDDSAIGIVDYLVRDMGSALAIKEDGEGIAGDGTSTYAGVLGVRPAVIAATASIHSAATGHDLWAELDITDFAGCMSLVPARFRVQSELSWLVNPSFKWQAMDRLSLAQGGASAGDVINGQPVPRFMGYPVVLSDDMPSSGAASTVCALFGNFIAAAALGDRQGIRIATSEHVAFTSDKLAIRATTRYDLNVHQAGTTSVAGAIVGLKTAS